MGGSTLNGQLLYVFVVAILDAAILSWIGLRWYQRAVLRSMRPSGVNSAPPRADAPAFLESRDHTPSESLRVAVYRTDNASNRAPRRREWPAGWRRIALAYCVGAGLFSAIITSATAIETSLDLPTAIFGTLWINAWPVVPTLVLLLLLDRRSSLTVVAAYLLGGSVALALLTLVLQIWRGAFNSAVFTNPFWLNVGILATAWLPLLLLLVSGWHRIRAVMPLALASTLVFGFGLLLFRDAITRAFNTPSIRDVLLQLAAMTSTDVAYYSVYMILALPAGWLAWRLLKALAAAFDHKRFSDVQLVIDCWWLIVTAEAIVTHVGGAFGVAWIAIGLGAFAVYRVGTFATLRLLRDVSPHGSTRLLLLRVFGHQSRSESLFDHIAQRWRFQGPVQLIAGVDLAMRTVDPGEMLAFVGGRLRDVYVSTLSELPTRLARLDMDRDPDGRFRVNDLYCADETWKDALLQLLKRSDIVVMDLRGFTKDNTGCVFELQQLVTHLPMEAIVLVCDKTTDLTALAALLRKAWIAGKHGTAGAGMLSLVQVNRDSPTELDILMERLLGRGTPQQVLALTDLRSLA